VIGGAFVLAMYCDVLVAAENTLFSYPEVAVGFTGGLIAGLVSRIPQKVAMEFMLMGAGMSAQRAYEVGLVNKVVPAGGQLDVAIAWAQKLAEGAPLVIAALKAFTADVLPASPAQRAAEARRVISHIYGSQDRFEGERAFREERPPAFIGR
jgi:enoyl-CoA hydratase/carnithine racemase